MQVLEQVSIVLFWIAFCGFVMATVTYGYEIARHHQASVLIARILTSLSWVMLTVSIGCNSMARHGTPLNGPNQLVLIAWALVLVYFLFEYLLKFTRYGAALIPLTALLMFIAQIITSERGTIAPAPDILTQQMNSTLVNLHVLLIIFANALLLIGCVGVALYLYQDHALRRHSNSALARALPPLANIERFWVRVFSAGLPIYVAGQMLGITRAIAVDAHLWYADIRIILSGAILLIFVFALVLYYLRRTSTVIIARIALAGGVLVVVLMIISRSLPVGFHVFGILG